MDIELLIRDVNKEGYNIEHYHELLKLKTKDKKLIPVFLKHLKNEEDLNRKELVIDCLKVKGFTDATQTLIEEFLLNDNRLYKWTIGDTFSYIQDKAHEDDYIDIVKNKQHGIARQMVVVTLGKIKSKKAIPNLINLLEDTDVSGHVIMALGYYGKVELIEEIEPFLEHDEAWIRNEAKKSIKKLEKHKK